MSLRPPMRRLTVAGLVLVTGASLAACSTNDSDGGPSGDTSQAAAQGGSGDGSGEGDEVADTATPPSISANVKKGATVPVSKQIQVQVSDGSLKDVKVTSKAGNVPGSLSDDGGSWSATDLLEPGATYTVRASAEGEEGTTSKEKVTFSTQALTLDDQTYPSVAPLPDQTVGVGMPVIVKFDIPVQDKASFEKHMQVTAKPAQAGSWNWISDNEAHWRPKKYWQAGSKVHVDVDVNGVDAGNGIYGQEDRVVDFNVGDAHIYKVNAATHQMEVFSNGKKLRTIPITTGKPGFTTRSGTKVIIEKFDSKRMNSETIGIDPNSSDGYDLDDVQWAMRVTYSGEFIHAAPWSTGSQGYANVSHGCTGLSTDNAYWLYQMTNVGDVVEYTGTDKPMEFTNGYGDWTESFKEYKQGSALA